MYNAEQIESLFGKDVLQYITCKERGGSSGCKGNTYENFFAIYQIALLARSFIEHSHEVEIFSQILAFVDDLIIELKNHQILQHFQLKNSASVSWGSGLRSIADDFEKQYLLNQTLSCQTELYLVVSNQALQNTLHANLPRIIAAYSQVLYFPFGPSLNSVLSQAPDFYAAVQYLCAFDAPDPDKVECVAAVLLGAWISSDRTNLTILELLTTAQKSTPSFMRSFTQNLILDPAVEEILSKIQGFTYNFSKGFLNWQFGNGLLAGTFAHSADTEEFRRFQDRLKRLKPTSFEELEDLL